MIELLPQLLDGCYKNQDLYDQLNSLISIILELDKTNVLNYLNLDIDFGYNLDNNLYDLIYHIDILLKNDQDRKNFYELVNIIIKNANILQNNVVLYFDLICKNIICIVIHKPIFSYILVHY